MNIKKYFGIPGNGHKNIEFIDISLDTDIELYLDPTLIEGLPTEWCKKAAACVRSFFEEVFTACREHDYQRLNELVGFGKEPNETKLGLSIDQSRGKGSKPESLYKIFVSVAEQCLIQNGIIENPAELCIFVKNFAEDRMSDLITNIIRKELYEFTMLQCRKHRIVVEKDTRKIGQCWSPESKQWEQLIGSALIVEGRSILLVPKDIVRRRFIVSVAQYLQKHVLTHRQRYHLDHNTDMVHVKYNKNKEKQTVPPTKKEVYAKEVKGQDHKLYVQEYTEENPHLIDMFRKQKLHEDKVWDYVLTDAQLDYYVYDAKVRSA